MQKGGAWQGESVSICILMVSADKSVAIANRRNIYVGIT